MTMPLVGECKWTAEPIRKGVVEYFFRQADEIFRAADKWRVTYALFSRSGFTSEARQAAGNRSCLWIGMDRIDTDCGTCRKHSA